MEINWFPGHMAKSVREIENLLSCADCVIYVLDCRAVRSCFNPVFDKMIKIPVVYVLNKADMVDIAVSSAWERELSVNNSVAIALDGTDNAGKKKLLTAIRKACAASLERQQNRGINEHLRAIVVGVPNTGKSTLINMLCGKARLETGDHAGVTRSVHWARVDEKLDILDTPGTLYPKISNRATGENLAIIGSIKDEVIDKTELALALIKRLNEIDVDILKTRYGNAILSDGGLRTIAVARGFKGRGGCPDEDRAAAAVLDDFRKGRLGKIALEYTDDR